MNNSQNPEAHFCWIGERLGEQGYGDPNLAVLLTQGTLLFFPRVCYMSRSFLYPAHRGARLCTGAAVGSAVDALSSSRDLWIPAASCLNPPRSPISCADRLTPKAKSSPSSEDDAFL